MVLVQCTILNETFKQIYHFKYKMSTKFPDLNNIVSYLKRRLKKASAKSVYAVLLLFYAYSNKNTPSWAKNIIIGAISYLLSPIDSIPDLTPFIGMTDDIGVLMFGISTIACYIDEDVRSKARKRLQRILGTGKDKHREVIAEVDSWL